MNRLSMLLACLLLALSSVCLAEEESNLDRDNIVIVLDASGSMNEQMGRANMRRIDAAKTALKQVLQTVPARTQVGLLVFSAANTQDDWVYPLAPLNTDQIVKAIDLPKPSKNTPLGKYIKVGVDRLLEQRKKQHGYGTYRLLIVTDGEAQDRNLVDKYTPEAMGRGVIIDVIGVDMKSDHTLSRLAHSYRRADDPAALQTALKEIFAEVGGSGSGDTLTTSFDEIAPLSPELAQGLLTALSVEDNQALGTTVNTPVAAQPTTVPQPKATNAPPATPRTSSSSSSGGGMSALAIFGIVLLFIIGVPILILVVIIIALTRKKKKG